jgi:hypothetical protein
LIRIYESIWRLNTISGIALLDLLVRLNIGDVEAMKIQAFGLRVSLGWQFHELPAEVLKEAKKTTWTTALIVLLLCSF